MKLVDTSTVLGRVNSLTIIIEDAGGANPADTLNKVHQGLLELKAGLDFHLESFPKTIAPGMKAPRKAKSRRKSRKRK